MKLKKYQKENAKLREQILQLKLDWESERDYANQMEVNEKKVVAENDKLRRELNFYKSQIEGVEEERLRLRKRWKKAVAENAKLRDFAELYLDAVSIDCNLCPYEDPELCDTETDPMCKGCRLWEEMQKLGVNADS